MKNAPPSTTPQNQPNKDILFGMEVATISEGAKSGWDLFGAPAAPLGALVGAAFQVYVKAFVWTGKALGFSKQIAAPIPTTSHNAWIPRESEPLLQLAPDDNRRTDWAKTIQSERTKGGAKGV